jgi:hypothetical protein
MDTRFHFDRRAVVAGLSGLGLAPAALARADDRPQVDGKTSWSESIMVVYLSDDLKTGISYRICRFPDLNDTWVWCNVIAEGRMYSYTAQYLPCGTHHNAPTDNAAVYDATGALGSISRFGTSAALQKVTFSFRGGAFAGTDPHEGAGPVPIAVEGVFHPEHLHAQMQPSRFERIGRTEARLTIAGKSYAISGVCKQHEQTQMAPRFLQAFTYCDVWNEGASLLGLLTQRASGGDFQVGDQSRKIARFEVAKPDAKRKVAIILADGTRFDAVAEESLTFAIPIYDRVWRGAMVAITVDGQRMVGTLNDWRADLQPYATDLT